MKTGFFYFRDNTSNYLFLKNYLRPALILKIALLGLLWLDFGAPDLDDEQCPRYYKLKKKLRNIVCFFSG